MKITSLLMEAARYQDLPFDENDFAASAARLVPYLQKHCRYAFNAYTRNESTTIYRGVNREGASPVFVQDTLSTTRKSANTHNYVTLLSNIMSSWTSKNIPPRSKGVSCTTSIDTADGYGQPYVAFPTDVSTRVYCKAPDFWEAFPKLEAAIGIGVNGLNANLASIHDTLSAFDIFKTPCNSPQDVVNLFDCVTAVMNGEHGKQVYDALEKLDIISAYLDSTHETFYDLIEDLLDPSEMELRVGDGYRAGVGPVGNDEEVFIAGNIIYVELHVWNRMLEQIKKVPRV